MNTTLRHVTGLCLVLILSTCLLADDQPQSQPRRITTTLPAHPRLMLTPEVKTRVASLIESDPWAKAFFNRIQLGAQAVKQLPIIERKLEGNKRVRLLATARDAIHNTVTLCMANTFKPDASIRQRAIDELMSIAAFEDWHPEHFLDTAEMTFAMAIGYDWLYNELTDEQRTTIGNAIIQKGLKAALKNKGGLNTNNNWNQVRHGGLTAGALAVYEEAPQLAEDILAQAHDNYQRALSAYEGDGIYPEGPTYWGYGTSYSWIMATCLQSATGDDWGILKSPGFPESFDYVLQVTAPTRKLFNFADCGLGPMTMPMHMWAGNLLDRPDFIQDSKQSMEGYIAKVDTTSFRMVPLALLWYKPVDQFKPVTPTTCYVGKGSKVHLAMIRSAWQDRNASFIGIKGGDIRVNHGHMDIGSFIIEADGVRWAEDLGAEKEIYDRSDGWSTSQDSKRWTYLRVNNFSHNTLTLGGNIQQVQGMNPIIASGQNAAMQFAVLEMSSAYKGQAQSMQRGIALQADTTMLVQDEFTGINPANELVWTMMTKARIKLSDDKQIADLEYGGKTLHVTFTGPVNAQFAVIDATPPTEVENQNSNYQRLIIRVPAPVADGSLCVQLVPGSVKNVPTILKKAIETWQKP